MSKELVDLIGFIAWPLCALAITLILKSSFTSILKTLADRISDKNTSFSLTKDGIEVKTIEAFKPDLAKLKETPTQSSSDLPTEGQEIDIGDSEFEDERHNIYERNRYLFLAHVLEPTKDKTQKYDIFIYLKRHKNASLDDILKTEFFFGRYWGNRVFEGTRVESTIGIRTSAYGEFLCTCRVHFKDGSKITLSRYIDFDSGKYITAVINQANQSLNQSLRDARH